MSEDLDFETYLSISSSGFEIVCIDLKKVKKLYEQNFKIENENKYIDLDSLNKFLNNNIFKIEKLIGKFIKNISLIIESNEINNIRLGIKKKNYEKNFHTGYLEVALTEIKDIFKESYPDHKIMHMIVDKYSVNGYENSSLKEIFKTNQACIEVQFKSISNNVVLQISKILEQYQIEIIDCMDRIYIENLFKNKNNDFFEMVHQVRNGINNNEIRIVPKYPKKLGIFEKFFQLFS